MACLALAGCRTLADHIARPQGQAMLPAATLAQIDRVAGVREARFRASDGAMLGYRELAPGRRGLRYAVRRREDGISFSLEFDGDAAPPPIGDAHGTVVLLHGWGLDGTAMLPWALALAERGYHTIIPDLRGHGRSRDAFPGLRPARGRGHRRAGGRAARRRPHARTGAAAGGLAWRGRGAACRRAARRRCGGHRRDLALCQRGPGHPRRGGAAGRMQGGGLRARAARVWMRRQARPEAVEAAMRDAGRRMGVDLSAIETGPAMDALRGGTLVLHGSRDGVFALADVEALARRSPLARFVVLEGENHLRAPLRLDLLAAPLADWFAQLPQAPCPGFELAAAPPAVSSRAR